MLNYQRVCQKKIKLNQIDVISLQYLITASCVISSPFPSLLSPSPRIPRPPHGHWVLHFRLLVDVHHLAPGLIPCCWPFGYGSIPIHTIFSGMNIHLPAILMFTRVTWFWPIPILRRPSLKIGTTKCLWPRSPPVGLRPKDLHPRALLGSHPRRLFLPNHGKSWEITGKWCGNHWIHWFSRSPSWWIEAVLPQLSAAKALPARGTFFLGAAFGFPMRIQ